MDWFMTSKEDTRKYVLNQRNSLDIYTRQQKSCTICKQLIEEAEHSGKTAKGLYVAAYEPMRSEVDVHPFLDAAYEREWHVCLPCMVAETHDDAAHMVFFELAKAQVYQERPAFLDHPARPYLRANLEAEGWHDVPPEAFDIAVIPLVAFDSTLMRLGYGGGNYDRFLPRLQPECFIAGVAFEEQRIPRVPTEPHDLPLPRIITA